MPASHSSTTSLGKLITKTDHFRGLFQKTYPEIYSQLQDTAVIPQHASPHVTQSQSALEPLAQNISSQLDSEEYEAVVSKAQAISQLPPGKIDTETALYLEQQLSDLLGFQISTKLEGNELPFSFGAVRALPHLKRSPTDAVQQHSYNHAPFSEKRGYFGWLPQQLGETDEVELLEKYYVAVPFFLMPEWDTTAAAVKEWYAFRKMVVINPYDQKAVVCSVMNSFDSGYTKYQFGVSPEVIYEGSCWSPKALGKVLVFFVLDDADQVPLGPISFKPGQNA